MEKVKTTCIYCGTGCQLWLKTKDGKVVDTKPVMPPEFNPGKGKLCIKGWNVHEFINHPDRLTDPLIKNKQGIWKKVSWQEAISHVAANFKKIRDENPDHKRAIGCFSSAKCTNEENYVMQKFARAVLKTNNVDHCARLCHSATVVGLGSSFGSGAMTNSIDEIIDAKVIFVIGSNTNEQHPLIGARILEALKKGAKLIVADPRTIPLSELAVDNDGIAMAHRPGTDVALLNGIMNVIIREKLYDESFVTQHCENFEAFREEVMKMTPETASHITGVPQEKIIQAARMIGQAETTYLIYSMGITQHTSGVDNVKSTANLQMLCGNIGKWATGVNPLRGQNNVQGACDMGALPNVFTGYQPVTDLEIRKKFAAEWKINEEEMDTQVGLTVVQMIDAAYRGELKMLYIMGENPVISDPDSNHVREALKKTFLVVQDIFMTPTTELADVILPAASFAEKEGTFTSTERRVQLVRKAIEPVGNSKPDWQIIALLAQEMGYTGLNYQNVGEILAEINRTTPSYRGITWERLQQDERGLQWPCPDDAHPGTGFLHKDGKFTRGKGYFQPIPYREPAELPDVEYPFTLSTGRTLWHFHTGTMSRRSKTLNERIPEGYVEISADDAQKLNINDNEMVRVVTRRGEIKIKAKITPKVSTGLIFIPFHFEEAAANVLTNAAFDPIAGIPEFKVCAARIEKIE
ncbi:MAG TPA: formate dehydrogenase subunit alpha [Atribacterota bacterium]|mgnify:CR=1 FL=1|nr:formate dehydrogenase subunit alpha [Atribacterota bacterium]